MPSASKISVSTLQFLAGLTASLEQVNKQNRFEKLAGLQLLGQQGFDIAPAESDEVRPASFLNRLFGDTVRATQPGTFAATIGNTPLVARRPPPVDLSSAPSGFQLTEAEQQDLGALLEPFRGQAATPQVRRALLGVRQRFIADTPHRQRPTTPISAT